MVHNYFPSLMHAIHALQFEDMSEYELDKYAHNAAEFLWCTVGDPSHPNLVRADFEEVLESPEDAEFAFQLFDVDRDGFVVEGEVHERFEAIYRCVCMCWAGFGGPHASSPLDHEATISRR